MEKKINSIKKKITVMTVSGAMAIAGIAGVATTAMAGNTTDTSYSCKGNTTGNTDARSKEDATKVYVHPTEGQATYYTVQGSRGAGWKNRSSMVNLRVGVYASITNYVYENDNYNARLHMTSTRTGNTTRGYWSPDSTRTYTVYD